MSACASLTESRRAFGVLSSRPAWPATPDCGDAAWRSANIFCTSASAVTWSVVTPSTWAEGASTGCFSQPRGSTANEVAPLPAGTCWTWPPAVMTASRPSETSRKDCFWPAALTVASTRIFGRDSEAPFWNAPPASSAKGLAAADGAPWSATAAVTSNLPLDAPPPPKVWSITCAAPEPPLELLPPPRPRATRIAATIATIPIAAIGITRRRSTGRVTTETGRQPPGDPLGRGVSNQFWIYRLRIEPQACTSAGVLAFCTHFRYLSVRCEPPLLEEPLPEEPVAPPRPDDPPEPPPSAPSVLEPNCCCSSLYGRGLAGGLMSCFWLTSAISSFRSMSPPCSPWLRCCSFGGRSNVSFSARRRRVLSSLPVHKSTCASLIDSLISLRFSPLSDLGSC